MESYGMLSSRVKHGLHSARAGSLAAGLMTLLLIPAGVSAQRGDDDRWLRDCHDNGDRDREVYCDVVVQTMAASRSLRIDAGRNGGVIVRGGNRRDIEVHARIQTRAETMRDARDLADGIQLNLDRGEISARGPESGRNESWSVTFYVYVPDRTDLDLQANNGPLSVEDVTGRIQAKTVNGPLSLANVSGDVNARTQNGPLNVELTGNAWNGAGLDAETVNGPVHLSIPDGYSAELETGTNNGPFNTEVPLTVTQIGRMSKRIETRLGRGGAPIRAVTTNGPVVIEQSGSRSSRER
jgi:DUF4097 and DUF4098 domain-containing protein YvlB